LYRPRRSGKPAGRKDTGLNFEESGCDYLLIDEAHMFKID